MQQISFNGLDLLVEANPIYFGVKLTKGACPSLKKNMSEANFFVYGDQI